MRVLIIPEDPTLDQYILKPVVERIFKELKRPARIGVLQDPRMGGVTQALDQALLQRVYDRYPMVDLFLLIVDRDGEEGRPAQVEKCESAAEIDGKRLIGCLAIEEVEVWALALHRDDLSDGWSTVRKERDPKEVYFEQLVKSKPWNEGVGRGRVEAMRALPGNWASLKSLCEEIQELHDNVKTHLTGPA